MCAGAILNAGIEAVVLGARIADIVDATTPAVGFRNYTLEAFAGLTGWPLTVTGGVLTDQCVALYREAAVPLTR